MAPADLDATLSLPRHPDFPIPPLPYVDLDAVDVDGDADLDATLGLPTHPDFPIPERHRKSFIEEFKNAADASEKRMIVLEEIVLRKGLFRARKESIEWEKSESKSINEEKGNSSLEEDEDADLENNPHKKLKIDTHTGTFTTCKGLKQIMFYMRCNRSYDAYTFTRAYKFVKGRKFCIAYDRNNPKLTYISHLVETDRCFDTPWIAVHGMETICLVTRRDMDMTRLPPYYQNRRDTAMHDFARALISEVECIPYGDFDYNDEELRSLCSVQRPFVVVSEVHHTEKDSGYDAALAVKFLQTKLSSNLTFTDYETIQTAILAYQHMHIQKLRAEDIWVTSFHFETGWYEHLHIDQIKEQLAIVNGLPSAEAPTKWPLSWHRRYRLNSDDTPVDLFTIVHKYSKPTMDMNLVVKKCTFPSMHFIDNKMP